MDFNYWITRNYEINIASYDMRKESNPAVINICAWLEVSKEKKKATVQHGYEKFDLSCDTYKLVWDEKKCPQIDNWILKKG